jgi:hypothetical protein
VDLVSQPIGAGSGSNSSNNGTVVCIDAARQPSLSANQLSTEVVADRDRPTATMPRQCKGLIVPDELEYRIRQT